MDDAEGRRCMREEVKSHRIIISVEWSRSRRRGGGEQWKINLNFYINGKHKLMVLRADYKRYLFPF
jgi:hypothetical protein